MKVLISFLSHQVKADEIGRTCTVYGEDGNIYNILVGNPEGMRTLG
jgi:hypothetical protein